jgi:DeoR/GlpR family transcriptional regulator of sugar metabolism
VIAAQRRNLIAEIVQRDGAASITALADRLDVSPITVRRDLDALDALGVVERTHGGAVRGTQAPESPYVEKIGRATREKAAIASVAAAMVADDDVIVIGPGTTTAEFARALAPRTGLTIVTNSLLVADIFIDSPSHQVILSGGELRGSIRATVGDAAARTFRGVHAHRAFLSGNGLDAAFGLSTPNMMVAETDRAIAGAADELVVLADHTKLGIRTAMQTVPVSGIRHLVTDRASRGAELEELGAGGVTVHLAAG